jgi:hypothetical protein
MQNKWLDLLCAVAIVTSSSSSPRLVFLSCIHTTIVLLSAHRITCLLERTAVNVYDKKVHCYNTCTEEES